MMLRITLGTEATKPGLRGDYEGNRKPIAQGMPDRFGGPVVTYSCAFYFCARGCGRAKRPAFPAPSDLGGMLFATTRERLASREGGDVFETPIQIRSSCPDLIRASIKPRKGIFEKRWMAGSSPAMTETRGAERQPPFDA